MVAVPVVIAVTTPSCATDATPGASDRHSMIGLVLTTTLPSASTAEATRRTVPPMSIVAVPGSMRSFVALGAPLSPPHPARVVARETASRTSLESREENLRRSLGMIRTVI